MSQAAAAGCNIEKLGIGLGDQATKIDHKQDLLGENIWFLECMEIVGGGISEVTGHGNGRMELSENWTT